MHIAILGTGYVGLVSGTCFAELGNTVTCYDIDSAKIEGLQAGKLPIYEPGLAELVSTNEAAGRLHFTTDLTATLAEAEVVFLAVGTPSAPDGSANLEYLFAAAESVAEHLDHTVVIATKSTVPVGTAQQLRNIFTEKSKVVVEVASNPEFLREGAAVKDFLNAERVIVGLDNPAFRPVFERLYQGITRADRPLLFMSVKSAELTKYAANAFLATKISFVNDMAMLAEATGANIKEITRGMGFDSRIGSRYLSAGVGYGGSCFPKDVRALQHMMRTANLDPQLIAAVEQTNEFQKQRFFNLVTASLGTLKGKTIAVWGLTFKPRTDDVRESAALALIPRFQQAGATIQAYDPKGKLEAARQLGEKGITYTDSSLEAVKNADALLVLTEWDEFRTVDLNQIAHTMHGKDIFDGRNIYTKELATAAGLTWHGIGITS
jgi:UDPglucose 6-dehydrogenase